MITVFQACNNNSMSEWSWNNRGLSRIHKRGPLPSLSLLLLPFPSTPSLPPPSTHFHLPPLTSTSLHSLPSSSLRSRLPLIQLGCLGSAASSPSRSRRNPAAKRYLVYFGLKMVLVRAILSIYSRKFTNKFDKFKKRLIFFSHQRGGRRKAGVNMPLCNSLQ